PALWALLDTQFAAAAGDRAVQQDDARLQEVLRLRKENFETHGDARQLVPGRSWAAWARALAHLLPPLTVADIGCGDGYLTSKPGDPFTVLIASGTKSHTSRPAHRSVPPRPRMRHDHR